MFDFYRRHLLLFVLLCSVLGNSVASLAQVTPQPLSDEEFQRVLQSSDTLEWMKIMALTDKQAKKLSKCDNAWYRPDVGVPAMMTLWLKGLKVLTDDQAHTLMRSKAMCILLDGLDSLSDKQANYLSNYSAQPTILHGSLPQGWDNGYKYGGVTVGVISLNRLSRLSDSQASKFGKFQASAINLNGLKSLTETQDKSLAKFEGIVDLDGVDLSAVGLFIKYKGKLRPPDPAPQHGPQLFVEPDSLRKK